MVQVLKGQGLQLNVLGNLFEVCGRPNLSSRARRLFTVTFPFGLLGCKRFLEGVDCVECFKLRILGEYHGTVIESEVFRRSYDEDDYPR